MTNRKYLQEFGAKETDTHCVFWVADDKQAALVVGLGASEEEALEDAHESNLAGNYDMDGGYLEVKPIDVLDS